MIYNDLPLKEVSIKEIYVTGKKCTYEIPIYQRNYAWEKDEISALVQDVWDAFQKDPSSPYYIGTLVSFNRGDDVYEIIDGQQRLTTINLLLNAFKDIDSSIEIKNRLTYRARKKSDHTLKTLGEKSADERDSGIDNGFRFARNAILDIDSNDIHPFISYFLDQVRIVHYEVPKDIDLNHYFEVMNSRGEQLEKHEIEKAKLMKTLDTDEERQVFSMIWDSCSEMSVYIQQNLSSSDAESIFSRSLDMFIPESFDDILSLVKKNDAEFEAAKNISINDILDNTGEKRKSSYTEKEGERKDSFHPIIDFSNFLLIVLKIARMGEEKFNPASFKLDDKELLNEFDLARMNADDVKLFGYMLLKARFYLDNYIIHHSNEADTLDSNPWKLQVWHRDDEDKKRKQLGNLCEDTSVQNRLVHLLSMFEVSFTARQRKNYLFYCLFYLIRSGNDTGEYLAFVEELADRYFLEVYLEKGRLNNNNTPLPGSFDEAVLDGNMLRRSTLTGRRKEVFNNIYGDGSVASRGVPLFIFSYIDYRLWRLYDESLRGRTLKREDEDRISFFDKIGCSDFGLSIFDQFYFSRTRRSLEHYYPQANVSGAGEGISVDMINCLGNYAMIGSEANSSGSNWSPKAKLDHYLDKSGKISQISVASLKFQIMLRTCRDNMLRNDNEGRFDVDAWTYIDICRHQEKMVEILLG